jgi:hypothetical protein
MQTPAFMGQLSDGDREAGSFGHGFLQRWGSVTSTTSSNDWNDIGLPPLPRQRSLSAPADANQQQQHDQMAYASSLSLPEQCMLQQQQHGMPLEALVYEAAVRQQQGGSPRSCMPSDSDAMLEGDSQAWDTLSPAAFATAAAFARARRSHQALHSSGSMSSTSSSSGSFASSLGHAHSGRSFSYTGNAVAMDVCSSGSARSLPCMDSLRGQESPKHADLQHAQAKLSPQELAMLTKLRAIMTEKEQLSSIEKQLRCKLGAETLKATSGSPRAAAQAAAARSAFLQQHQHQRSGCARSPQARALHQSAPLGSPAAAPAGGSPCRHSSSTAAALLASGADPALIVEYVRAHKQQQQQHQACAAAVAAAAAAVSSPRAAHTGGQKQARKQGLSPVAMAKLRQLMALQQQQIQVQQVGRGVLCCAVLVSSFVLGTLDV